MNNPMGSVDRLGDLQIREKVLINLKLASNGYPIDEMIDDFEHDYNFDKSKTKDTICQMLYDGEIVLKYDRKLYIKDNE